MFALCDVTLWATHQSYLQKDPSTLWGHPVAAWSLFLSKCGRNWSDCRRKLKQSIFVEAVNRGLTYLLSFQEFEYLKSAAAFKCLKQLQHCTFIVGALYIISSVALCRHPQIYSDIPPPPPPDPLTPHPTSAVLSVVVLALRTGITLQSPTQERENMAETWRMNCQFSNFQFFSRLFSWILLLRNNRVP